MKLVMQKLTIHIKITEKLIIYVKLQLKFLRKELFLKAQEHFTLFFFLALIMNINYTNIIIL